MVYWDCPGFNDTKGSEQDITNGFYIKSIFDKSEEVKIIIVISEKTIQGRAEKFIGVLKKLENLLVDLDKMMKSICLVLTQTTADNTIDDFRYYLKTEFIPKQAKYLSEKQQLLIQ